MSFNALSFYRKYSGVLHRIAAATLLPFFAVLIVITPLVISPAASAADIAYVGDGAGLQTTPGWLFGGVASSLFPGTTAEPLSSDNSVTIDYSAGGGAVDPPHVFGGLSEQENAANNEVKFIDGYVNFIVYGGYSYDGNATNNAVTISGGTAGAFIFGGYSDQGNAESNIVTISGGTLGGYVYGGAGYRGNADSNKVDISGGSVGGSVYGGISFFGNADSNKVDISGGSVGDNVYGGQSMGGDADSNKVNISGGELSWNVYGGHSSGNGNVEYNLVAISGGTVSRDVYGGYSDQGDATYNTVTIMGNPTLTTSNIFGGYSGSGIGNYFTGNTLNFKSSNITVAGIGNFEYYNFYLPDGAVVNAQMLLVTDGVDLTDATAEVFLQGKPSLQAGDKVSLINSAYGVSNYYGSNSQASLGAFLIYDFSIYADANDLWAELTSIKVSSGSKALTNSRAAPLAFLNQGADLAASLEHLEFSGGSRYNAFAIVGGGSSTYDTGSDVDVKGVSVLAGVTWDAAVKNNSLSLSAFIEAGWGSYDTDNSFGGTSLKGSGNTDYYGGGLYLRHNWDSGLYADASLRVGHMSTDFDSSDLGVSGSSLHYDSGSTYYGAHAGLGYRWNLSGKSRLEVSGKYLWTRLDSDEITASSGDEIRFDSANSNRFRAGFRLYHDYGNEGAVTLYYGVAYEYEFDGDTDGRLYGAYALGRSSLSGGSGIGEVGVTFRPSKDNDRLTMQLGLQGYVGVREGISGTLKLQYAF